MRGLFNISRQDIFIVLSKYVSDDFPKSCFAIGCHIVIFRQAAIHNGFVKAYFNPCQVSHMWI